MSDLMEIENPESVSGAARQPMIGVYLVRNTVNNMVYVGSSSDIERRIATHRSQLRTGKHPSKKLQAAWDEHGEDSFEFVQACSCEEKHLVNTEQRYIKDLSAATIGYNTSPTATGRRVKSPGPSTATERALKLVAQGKMTPYAAAKKTGIALSTVYRALKRIKEQGK